MSYVIIFFECEILEGSLVLRSSVVSVDFRNLLVLMIFGEVFYCFLFVCGGCSLCYFAVCSPNSLTLHLIC